MFADGIWYDDVQYWPVITSWRKGTMDDAFCAVLPAPQEEAIDAATIARSAIEHLVDWAAGLRTRSEVRKLVSKAGLAIRPKLDPEDVTPVEAVLWELEEEEAEMPSLFSADLEIDEPKSWPARPFLIAAIWHHVKRYWPVLTFGPEDPTQDPICAVKNESRRRPTKAALIALIDLKQTQLLLEPICTDTQARQFMTTKGYTVRPDVDVSDVTPADDVSEPDEFGMNLLALAMDREVEEYIRIGDPPIFKETSERLIGIGLSDDEAIGLMCKALVEEYSWDSNHEITPESLDRIVQILSRLPDLQDN
ncbi:MAG TPA: hypothetical protein VGK48_20080 [Terriglobia bacterium]